MNMMTMDATRSSQVVVIMKISLLVLVDDGIKRIIGKLLEIDWTSEMNGELFIERTERTGELF